MLDTEYKYYLEHQQELPERYRGRFLVIIGNAVAGDYDSQAAAYLDSIMVQAPIVKIGKESGRNDPSLCGSGKKYKHCHGKQ